MSISPLILLFGLLIIGTALLYLVAVSQPKYLDLSAVIFSFVSLLGWLAVRLQLPVTFSLSAQASNSLVVFGSLQVDETLWSLAGILFLLVLALTVFAASQPETLVETKRFNYQLTPRKWQPILLFALLISGVTALWSANLPTQMTAWTALALFWSLFYFTCKESEGNIAIVIRHMLWLLIPLVFSGLALAVQSAGSSLVDLSSWTPTAVTALLLAAMAQLGILPFIGWRPLSRSLSAVEGAALNLIPALVGIGFLVRFTQTGALSTPWLLIFTLFGLLTILSGVRRSWVVLDKSSRFAANFTLSLAGLTFLSGLWAGSGSLIAGARVLILVPTLLFMSADLPFSRSRRWRGVGPGLAIMALAGLPLTAGLIQLSAIYNAWLANSRWIFILVLILLMIPLLTAVLITTREYLQRTETADPPGRIIFAEIGQLLPAVGLLMLQTAVLGEIKFISWLALILTAAGAVSFFLVLGTGQVRQERVEAINAAFTLEPNRLSRSWPTIARFTRQIALTLREAALIIEGEYGLLILVAFLAVILVTLFII